MAVLSGRRRKGKRTPLIRKYVIGTIAFSPMALVRNKSFAPVLFAAIFLLSFLWYSSVFQDSLKHLMGNCFGPVMGINFTFQPNKAAAPRPRSFDLQSEINSVFNKIQRIIPNVTFTFFNRSTSAKISKVSIVNRREHYCLGEDLVVQVDMYDHLGDRKTYGGDFIRSRLFSHKLGAAVSGRVEDFHNGSYHVHFPLRWVDSNKTKVSIQLMHPSEGIAALWRARHASLGVLGFNGKYECLGKEAITDCHFQLNTTEEVCEYKDKFYEEAFYCIKPKNISCECLHDMRAVDPRVSYLTEGEGSLFARSNIGVEMAKGLKTIVITDCGFVKYFRFHEGGWHSWQKTLEALNMDKDIYVSYKRHGFPLESFGFYYFKEDMYTSRQIDQRGGGKDTIFVISMGQHFRQFPLTLYIRRAINIRRAVERLFLRSPDTKVIIKTENTRQFATLPERVGDFHGYTQYLVLREVFVGMNVGFVDAWDMTVASCIESVHPFGYTLNNILSMTFSMAC
ncbi:NXPE family member 1-like isoform X3 [Hyla sarda]|uniref:NXPE family member 1-like isoform X3 n=1 Tax=Hyla sarda TaxID=327740 RepID=UPI0024C33571|nr:NXPE family member 1-like isoform X3 [Hyla sarda]